VVPAYISAAEAKLPLTIYYDHSCVVCRSEVTHLAARDQAAQLHWVDCSTRGFDTSQLPVNQSALMQAIHAIDASGRWLKGSDVFVVCYRTVGFVRFSGLMNVLKPVLNHLYPWIARNRHLLAFVGVPQVFNWLTKRHAAAALKRSQACQTALCEMKK
jgi:predicted DCC family thiol-disulfide oxidoreductase YuxK